MKKLNKHVLSKFLMYCGSSSIQDNQNSINKTAHVLVLLHAGSKGKRLVKSIKNSLKCMLSENVTTRVTYSGTRLSSKFTKIKDKAVKKLSRKSVLRRLNNVIKD